MPEGVGVAGTSEFGELGIEEQEGGVGGKVPRIQRDPGFHPKAKEVYTFLKKYMRQPERKKWLEVRRQCWDAVYESKIWTDLEIKEMADKGMIPLTINDLYKGVQGSSAIVTDQKPGIDFLPVGSGDLYVAELMKRAHDQLWAMNDGGTEVYEFVKEAKIGGLGVIDCKHDPSKGIYGKCCFGHFDPEILYYDMKKARKADLSDVHLLKAHLITKTQAKETYEDLKDEDLTFTGADKHEIPDKIDDYKTGEDNYVAPATDTPAGPDDMPEEKEEVWEIEAHLLKREIEYWVMTPDGQGNFSRQVFKKEQKAEAEAAKGTNPKIVLWKRLVEKRYLRIVVGKKLIPQATVNGNVEESVNPYGVDVDGDPVLPVIVLAHDKTRKGRPISPTPFALEACKERNKRRAQGVYVVSKNVDAPMVVAGGYTWKRDPVHGDILQVDKTAPFAPTRLLPGVTPADALKMESVAKADVDEMYDMQDVMKGKIPPGDPSGRTVLALQDMAGMMSKPFTRGVEASLVRLGKVDMAMILKHWPRFSWERLIEPDEMETWIPEKDRKQENPIESMNGNLQEPNRDLIKQKWTAALEAIKPADPEKEGGISLMDIDVRVAAGSTMPTNRMARRADARENVREGIYDAEAALDYMDDPKKDQIVARMKAKEKAMMAVGIMQKK